jgi:hypothetical protein
MDFGLAIQEHEMAARFPEAWLAGPAGWAIASDIMAALFGGLLSWGWGIPPWWMPSAFALLAVMDLLAWAKGSYGGDWRWLWPSRKCSVLAWGAMAALAAPAFF